MALLKSAPPPAACGVEHARAVSDLSRRIGAELNLGERALETPTLGAFLHDVGKNAVCETILRGP